VFARRLQQFYASTSPLLSYYGEGAGDGAPLVALAGSTSDEIWPLLDAAVLRVCPDLPLRADASRGRERDEQRKAALADAVCAEKRDMKSDMTGTPALH
jgi:nucleoside-triphosphate--adenylate kinase